LKIEAHKLKTNMDTREYFSNVAFVIFNKINDYEEFYSWFPHSLLSYLWFRIKKFFYCCCKVKAQGKDYKWMSSFLVEKAPEPEDIIWENLNYKNSERYKRTIKTYFYSILLSIVNLGIILGLNYAQVHSIFTIVVFFNQIIDIINTL